MHWVITLGPTIKEQLCEPRIHLHKLILKHTNTILLPEPLQILQTDHQLLINSLVIQRNQMVQLQFETRGLLRLLQLMEAIDTLDRFLKGLVVLGEFGVYSVV